MRQFLFSAAIFGAVAAAAISAIPGTAEAHHSLSAYNITKSIVVEGTIKKYEWTSPHCWLTITVPDDKGGTVDWVFEAGTPVVNNRYGWGRDQFKAGEKVKATAFPVRDGSNHGALISVEFADGRKQDGALAQYLKQSN
jgi:hypothetical protein